MKKQELIRTETLLKLVDDYSTRILVYSLFQIGITCFYMGVVLPASAPGRQVK